MAVTILTFISIISIICASLTAAFPNAPSDANGIPFAQVTVNSKHKYKIPLRQDGKLTYHTLSDIDVSHATVRSDVNAVCFFWREKSLEDKARSDNVFISHPFTYLDPLLDAYAQPDRFYCYDNALHNANRDTFTILLENRHGGRELVDVKLFDGRTHGVFDFAESSTGDVAGDSAGVAAALMASGPRLEMDVARAAIVDHPELRLAEMDDWHARSLAECAFVTEYEKDFRMVPLNKVVQFPSGTNLERIVCFSEGYRRGMTK